jgi:DNA-binding winged helix-turn-helix (wHTH) protein
MSLQFRDFELDRERRQLLRSGQPVPLEPKAYELLSLLVERRPKALSRAQIRDVVWPGVFISESTLGVAVNAIRQALGDDGRQPLVEPAKRLGYRFDDEALAEEMVGSVEGARAALPLLAFAVARLWEMRDRGRMLLAREAYLEIGGVAGALAQHAEAALDRVGVERLGLVRELLRDLVTGCGRCSRCTCALRDPRDPWGVDRCDEPSAQSLPSRNIVAPRFVSGGCIE